MPPPDDGSGVEVAVGADSKRLQRLTPWAAWDGSDIEDCAILLKSSGKTTTDHISPAGPWLRYRGHLDNISDNTFTGVNNAFTSRAGTGKQHPGPASARQPLPEIARAYRAAGQPWVVVGDENFGEGSSREHAAMQPRHLGAVAIIVRSFARIHETNLKKQGLLPLRLSDAADYDKFGQDDRVSIRGLASLDAGRAAVPGGPASRWGVASSVEVRHTFTEDQIGWFRAGGALKRDRCGAAGQSGDRGIARRPSGGAGEDTRRCARR